MPAGRRLLDALHDLLAGGFDSAALTLQGGALDPFAYVMPARSPDAAHAAFYSAPLRPHGSARLKDGAVTVGYRDGQPFFHCHALWTGSDGRCGCGHVLPDETMIAAPIEVRGVGLVGARFEVQADEETGFSLFVPVPTQVAETVRGANALAFRLAPNQDLVTALQRLVATAGFSTATLAGGVGSTIEARFVEGPPLTGFATELFVRHALINGRGSSELDIAIVDLEGTIREGRLLTGDNPVLMTFEGVLIAR